MIEVTTDVWRIDAPLLKMPAGVRMPLASTILRLPDRSLVIYGPIKFDDAQLAAIEALGEVAHLVAPNLYHHLFLPRAMARWPRATVHAPAGLETKRAELTAGAYRPIVDGALAPTLDVLAITGAPKLAETVLFHRPSGTLVCADLVFNVTQPANLRTRMALSMMGTGGQRLAQSRVWKFIVRDVAATRGAIDRMLGWPITRIAMAHGDPVPTDPARLATLMKRAYRGKPALGLAQAGTATDVPHV